MVPAQSGSEGANSMNTRFPREAMNTRFPRGAMNTRFPREAWLPMAAGLVWLWCGSSAGLFGFAITAVPGALLLGSGVAMLLMPGDPRITQLASLGGVGGAVLALPAAWFVGFFAAFAMIVTALAAALSAGAHAARLEPNTDEVPEPIPSMSLYAQVALDEALLATMLQGLQLPAAGDFARVAAELAEARELFAARGWSEKLTDYHQTPPELAAPTLRSARSRGIEFEHLSFDSEFEPDAEEPGRERWLSYGPNRTAHAWVLRAPAPDRPWLVAIHGYQMGWPLIDWLAFEPAWLHDRLGMNLLLPVLPLHGPRKIGRRSGDGYLSGDILDTLHGQAQAIWDIRRLIGWVRAQSDAPVGTLGYSLGGYTTALLASLEEGLACAIAGIPAADFTRLLYRHGPPLELQAALQSGLDEDEMRDVLRVVSPLDLAPRIPVERRFLFGAVADRLVSPDQVRDLWRHWERPRICWYQGAHITFRGHSAVHRFIGDGLRESGLARSAG